MTDKAYIKNLRIPTKDDPLRVLVSACLVAPSGLKNYKLERV
jgi:hypothetical protein